MIFPVYVRLTLEFLCTLEIALFKVPFESSVVGIHLKIVGGTPYVVKSVKDSRIHNLVFCYIHKVMAHTMCHTPNLSNPFQKLYNLKIGFFGLFSF